MVGQSYTVTASTFGGPGDPSTGSTGYRGDNLNAHPDSFAELSNNPSALDFSALGNLPHNARVTVTNPANGRSMVLYKRDVGAGGAGMGGTKRGIDLWYKAAQQLGINGLGVVKVSVGGAPGNAAMKGVAQQRGRSVTGGIAPTTSSASTGGNTDFSSAIVDALLSGEKPINFSGKVSSGGGILSKALANVATGAYTSPVVNTITKTLGRAGTVQSGAAPPPGRGRAPANVPNGSGRGILQRSGLHLGRTDMGVDFTGVGGIPAVIQGTVVHVDPRGSGNGWPGGAMVVIHGTGPDAGKITYLAENYNPTVKVGQHVMKGQSIGTALGTYPYTEYGWAANDSGQTLSAAHGTQNTHPNHSNTPEGTSFLHYLGY